MTRSVQTVEDLRELDARVGDVVEVRAGPRGRTLRMKLTEIDRMGRIWQEDREERDSDRGLDA